MRGLFAKYVVLIGGLVSLLVVAASALGFWFLRSQNEAQLHALQQEKAQAAAMRIGLFAREVQHQIGWTMMPGAGEPSPAQRRIDFLKLLRQVPAITDVMWIDARGRERLRVSRLQMDRSDSGLDWSGSALFREARRGRAYFGPVHFREGSEPYMTVALREQEAAGGVIAAEINLKFVWEVITQIRVGRTGLAYVVDASGNLVAHPDISLVLRKTSMLQLAHVAAPAQDANRAGGRFVRDLNGREVLSAFAPTTPLGWNVFVELPRDEALEPLYLLARRGALLAVAALALAVAASVLLARRMAEPIRALQAAAEAIGAGKLDGRIDVKTGDEIGMLADQFNIMTTQLRETHGTLEERVRQRTHAAEAASLAKSRFLAAASHDLRQPMHALNLYLGALHRQPLPPDARPLLENVIQCTQTMDGLFESLLDISKLDAGAVTPRIESFLIGPLLNRIAVEIEPQAREKGLRLRVRACPAWVRSDPALVERIVRNLVSNAVRYTASGRILIGCRRAGGRLSIQVHDTGMGIPPDQQALVFEEFYQVANPERDRSKGLGLGLSIVQRLAKLLDAPLTLRSRPGAGSMFAVDLAIDDAPREPASVSHPRRSSDALQGKLVVVVDDEVVVLHATRALLETWGCEVVTAESGALAIERLAAASRAPDVLLCDYRLRGPENGLLVMENLREEFNRQIPAAIITGDVLPESIELEAASDVAVLHKPVADALLRETLERLAA
jgi:signal transduction histidine kinase/CheY-like chemotaxis protein